MSLKLTPELKEKWCEALESGEYKQGHGRLVQNRFFDNGEVKNFYCCLGVLEKIAGFHSDSMATLIKDGETAFLTFVQQVYLYNLNDNRLQDFREIAKYIRKNIEPEPS